MERSVSESPQKDKDKSSVKDKFKMRLRGAKQKANSLTSKILHLSKDENEKKEEKEKQKEKKEIKKMAKEITSSSSSSLAASPSRRHTDSKLLKPSASHSSINMNMLSPSTAENLSASPKPSKPSGHRRHHSLTVPTAVLAAMDPQPTPTKTAEPTSSTVMPIKVEYKEKVAKITLDVSKTVYSNLIVVADHFGISQDDAILCHLYKKKKLKNGLMSPHKVLTDYKINAEKTLVFDYHKKPKKGKNQQKDMLTHPSETEILYTANFLEKLSLSEERSVDHMAFEVAAHCILNPMLVEYDAVSSRQKSELLKVIQNGLGIPEDIAEEIENRVLDKDNKKVQAGLMDMEYRYYAVDHHPFYCASNFKNDQEYQIWKKREKASILEIAKFIMLKLSQNIGGNLKVHVMKAEGLAPADVDGKADPYVILSCESSQTKTKYIKHTLEPEWGETFEMEVTDPNAKLDISIFDKDIAKHDDFMDHMFIPVADILAGKIGKGPQWYPLPVQGRIQLEIELSHHYSPYLDLFTDKSPANNTAMNSTKTKNIMEMINFPMIYARLEKILVLDPSGDFGLANETQWFLDEFSTRFGVGDIFTRLSFLGAVSTMLEPIRDQLEGVSEGIMELLNAKESGEVFTKKELLLLENAEEQLEVLMKNFLSKYRELFGGKGEQETVGVLCDILRKISQKDFLGKLTNCVESCAKTVFKQRHDKVKMSEMQKQTELIQGSNIGSLLEFKGHQQLNPDINRLIRLTSHVRDELAEEEAFSLYFPKEFHFLDKITRIYYGLLSTEISTFLEKVEFSDDIFQLYFELKEFHQFFKVLISKTDNPVEMMDLGQVFAPFVYSWIKETSKKISEWMKNACLIDQKKPISKEIPYSSSVVDAFSFLEQSTQFLSKLALYDPFFVLQLAEILFRGVEEYAKIESDVLFAALPKSVKKLKGSAVLPTKIPPTTCVILNNLSESRNRLESLTNQLETLFEDFGTLFLKKHNESDTDTHTSKNPTIQCSKETLDKCIKDGIQNLRTMFEQCLDHCTGEIREFILFELLQTQDPSSNGKENTVLKTYLDDQLNVFADHVTPDTFKRILRKLWVAVVQGLKEAIFPSKMNEKDLILMERDQAVALVKCLDDLEDYFYANGNGLTKEFIAENSKVLTEFLQYYQKSTPDLIKLFYQQTEENIRNAAMLKKNAILHPHNPPEKPQTAPKEQLSIAHLLKILEGRKNDKYALPFVEEQHSATIQEANKKVRVQFLLPENEVILAKYSVNTQKSGFLYLTTSYLLFDNSDSTSADSEDQISVKHVDITSVARSKYAFVFDVITVTTKSKETFEFKSIKNLEEMMARIIEYAKLAGNTAL